MRRTVRITSSIYRQFTERHLSLPAVVIEFANAKGHFNDRKEAQLFLYAWNNTRSLPKDASMLTMGVSFVELQTAIVNSRLTASILWTPLRIESVNSVVLWISSIASAPSSSQVARLEAPNN
jgi:hypothetical protein